MWLDEVTQFMNDNIIHKPRLELEELPVKCKGSTLAARAPAESQVVYFDAGWVQAVSTR